MFFIACRQNLYSLKEDILGERLMGFLRLLFVCVYCFELKSLAPAFLLYT